jgi:hypothetical protein
VGVKTTQGNKALIVDLTKDEINLMLTCVGIALTIVLDTMPREQLLALQDKLMKARDG